MNASNSLNYETVLKAIHSWTPDKRLELAQDILKTLNTELRSHPRRRTLPIALGMLATSKPAPTDEEVQQWLDERRLEKYG